MTDLYQTWLNASLVSDSDKASIKKFSSSQKKKFFNKPITIINNSIRVPIGLGSNTFNVYNFQLLAEALFKQFLSSSKESLLLSKKIIICHDNRQNSLEISQSMAAVFLYFGIEVFFFSDNQPVPTPFLSYLLKNNNNNYQLGIMITASHNHAKINGCKFMYSNGTTFSYQDCQKLNDYIQKNYKQFFSKTESFVSKKKARELNFTTKNDYLKALLSSPKLALFFQKRFQIPLPKLQIYYSALNGVGEDWTDQLLQKGGFQPILIKKQCQGQKENSSFKNVFDSTPNPELDKNFIEAFQVAKQDSDSTKYDLIILNDADADRMRFACTLSPKKQHLRIFSGNEIAIIFLHFLLFYQKRQGKVYRSQVSSFLIDTIAKTFPGVDVETTNTGFNYLAEKYSQNSNSLFAFEESLGFLLDFDINSDKDGLQGALFIANIAQYLALHEKINLVEYLDKIYQEFDQFWSLIIKEKKTLAFQKKNPFSQTLFSGTFLDSKAKKIHCFHRWSQTEPLILKNYFYGLGKKIKQNDVLIDKHLQNEEKKLQKSHEISFDENQEEKK